MFHQSFPLCFIHLKSFLFYCIHPWPSSWVLCSSESHGFPNRDQNAPVSHSGYTSVHISLTHSLGAETPNQYGSSSQWMRHTRTAPLPNTHTQTLTHTHTRTQVSLMLQAGDKSSSQFYSICHHSQLPTDAEQWPRCLEASAKLQLWSLQATRAWSDKTMKMKPVSTDCINFLPSFSEFLCDLKVFDHMMLACSFILCSFFVCFCRFSLSLFWTAHIQTCIPFWPHANLTIQNASK